MKMMLKRCLSLLLVLLLIMSCCTLTFGADEEVEFSSDNYDVDSYYKSAYSCYYMYMRTETYTRGLAGDSWLGFPQWVNNLKDSWYFQSCLDSAEFVLNMHWSKIIVGTYNSDDVKVQNYVTALSSLMMTMSDTWEDVKKTQTEADATMKWNDYGFEALSVAEGFASEAMEGSFKTAADIMGLSTDIFTGSIQTIQDFQNLEENTSTYLMYHDLLETIHNNTDDEYLKKASKLLLNLIDLGFKYLMSSADSVILTQFKLLAVLVDKIQSTPQVLELFSEDEQAALKCLNCAASTAGSFRLGVDAGKFLMDVLINSSDTILRYYEMCAMDSVRKALLKKIKSNDSQIKDASDWDLIVTNRDLLISLVCTCVRGEYCAYSLMSEDMGIISGVRTLIRGNEDKEWFNAHLNTLTKEHESLVNLFPGWDTFRWDYSDVGYVDFTMVDKSGYQSAIITAYDTSDTLMWNYESEKYIATDCPAVTKLGLNGNRYYYLENGSVVCLDAETGEVLWKNSDFGDRTINCILGDDAIYLNSFNEPHFYAVSFDGETLSRIAQFDYDYWTDSGHGWWWGSDFELYDEDTAVVYLYDENPIFDLPVAYYVDLDDYSYTRYSPASSYQNCYKAIVDQYARYKESSLSNDMFWSDSDTGYITCDIDNEGFEELIVKCPIWNYIVYTYDGFKGVLCGIIEGSNHLAFAPLYKLVGNGIVVDNCGNGMLAVESVCLYTLNDNTLSDAYYIADSAEKSSEEIYEMLSKYKPLDNFYSLDDYSGIK